MPSTYFYADARDARLLAERLFADKRLEVWEADSEVGQDLRQFHEGAELAAAGNAISSLALYAPSMAGAILVRRIDLEPETFGFGAYRFEARGWGLIFLQFVFAPLESLMESRVTVNSEARATKWSEVEGEVLGNPAQWDWAAVMREYRRVARHANSLAVGTIGGAPVLPSVGARVREGKVRLSRQLAGMPIIAT